ncbi:MAG: DUF190 domain-containing protein [Thermoplasmatota archaeon]
MNVDEPAQLLRIYLGEGDHHQREALYKAVVHLLRERGFWGATVLRGVMGYGKRNLLHSANVELLGLDLPIIVEVVERKAKVEAVLPALAALLPAALITTQDVRVHTGLSGGDPGA